MVRRRDAQFEGWLGSLLDARVVLVVVMVLVLVVHLVFDWFRARPFSLHTGVSGPPRGWFIFLLCGASPFLGAFFGAVERSLGVHTFLETRFGRHVWRGSLALKIVFRLGGDFEYFGFRFTQIVGF